MSEKATSVGHYPDGRWKFDDGVTRVFDDMIERSIPQYEVMRASVASVARWFLRDRPGVVVDLGCSTGLSIQQLASSARRVIGAEVSGPMLEAARVRFQSYANVEILQVDLREDYPSADEPVDVVLSVLTLQFVPIEHRFAVVRRAYESLRDGGAMVVVEKVLAGEAGMQRMLVDSYHAFKVENGYSPEEVRRKALSLEGALVPLTAAGNVEMLRNAGFRTVECFWRWMNFGAWVAVR